MAQEPLSFKVGVAAKLAELTVSMVHYLCRTEILIPTERGSRGRGRHRLYSFGDVVILRAIAKLLKNGVSVSRLKAALVTLRSFHSDITPNSLPGALLCTDGKYVYFKKNRDVLEDLNRGQFAFAFIIELASIQKEIMAKTAIHSPKSRNRKAVGA